MSKIYSIDSDNLSPLGTATTRDLDPFGTASNQSLGLFGGANISELYPYYLTLSPDSIDQISDLTSIHFTKRVSDLVSQTDSIFVRSQFRRFPNDLQNAVDEIQSFTIDKRVFDLSLPIDHTALSFNKPLYDVVDNLQDLKYLHFTKNTFDLTNIVNDSLESILFGKNLFETPLPSDQIQSFNVTKLLQDFANPVDYVGIPDGSTFQLNKTLRNTVLLDDDQSFVVNKSLTDFYTAVDAPHLHTNKPLNDTNSLFDNNTLSFNKAVFDIQNINEYSILDFSKVLNDIEVILDLTLLNLNKPLSDLTNTQDQQSISFTKLVTDIQPMADAIQSFDVIKLLEDFANPVDLVNIPDGSTFQLNKTLRNTVENITDVILLTWIYERSLSDSIDFINDAQLLNFAKTIGDNQALLDEIQSFAITKILQDYQSVDESLSFAVEKVLASSAVIEERKYAHLSKTFADDFSETVSVYSELTSNKDLDVGNALLDLDSIEVGSIDFNNGSYSLPTVSTIFDTLVSVNIGKGLFDEVLYNDQIQSFNINKVLSDYANPVDFVGIPDGSTFELIKTLRNTVLISDQTSLVWRFKRSFTNESYVNDLITSIRFNKNLTEELFANDDLQSLVLDKSLFEILNVPDLVSLSVDKPFTNSFSTLDFNTLNLSKNIFEDIASDDNLENLLFDKRLANEVVLQDVQSFDVTKLLEDFANPVDLINIPDGSTFQLNKTLRNTVLLSDDQSFAIDKALTDLQFVVDEKTIEFIKRESDIGVVQDKQFISLTKLIFDFVTLTDEIFLGRKVVDYATDSTTIDDLLSFGIGKSLTDMLSLSDNNSLSINIVKNDFTSSLDQIQSFSVTKLLEDFANPVDLVGIPDGTTFQFNKTLRNTALVNDQTSLVWEFNRSFLDEQIVLDAYNLSLAKQLANKSKADDDYALIINKSIFDIVIVSDLTAFSQSIGPLESANTFDNTNVSLFKVLSNSASLLDNQTLFFNKVNSENILTDDNQSFSVTKLLEDFANPVDLVNIPDGSIFQLNKTLRNTILLDDDQSLVVDKSLSDIQNINELLTISFNKFLYDQVSVSDFAQTSGIEADEYSDFTSVNDNSSLGIQKTLFSRLGDAAYYNLENNLDFNTNSGSYDIQSYDGVVDLNNSNVYISGVILDDQTLSFGKSLIESITINELNVFNLLKKSTEIVSLEDFTSKETNKSVNDLVSQSEFQAKIVGKYFTDFITIADNTNVIGGGNDYTSNEGDLSNIEDFGSLYMTDYADITYFAEDYVGESRTFT